MSAQTKAVLRNYFLTGNKPTEAQFGNLIDSAVAFGYVAVRNSAGTLLGTLSADDMRSQFDIQGSTYISLEANTTTNLIKIATQNLVPSNTGATLSGDYIISGKLTIQGSAGTLVVGSGISSNAFITSVGDITASDGNITCGASKGFFVGSDERWKKNVLPIDQAVIDAINNINYVQYEWKSTGEADYGVIAQQVEIYMPHFVKANEEGYKSVDYTKLLLLKSVAADQKIAKLEQRIEKLEQKLGL